MCGTLSPRLSLRPLRLQTFLVSTSFLKVFFSFSQGFPGQRNVGENFLFLVRELSGVLEKPKSFLHVKSDLKEVW